MKNGKNEGGRRKMDFGEWVETVPERVRAESCWRFEAYPKALYLYELTWDDCNVLMRDARGRAVAKQLIRSAGSISANVEEGYGRGVGGKEYLFLAHRRRIGPRIKGLVFSSPPPAGTGRRRSATGTPGRDPRPPRHRKTPPSIPSPLTPSSILHSPFSILGGALWPSCNTLS